MKMISCVYHALVQHRSKQIYMGFKIHFTSSAEGEKPFVSPNEVWKIEKF